MNEPGKVLDQVELYRFGMRQYGFMDRDIDLQAVYSSVKMILEKQGFIINSEEIHDGYWDLHAKKSGLVRIATGTVRDVDLIVTGNRKKASIHLHAGIWGRDFIIPAIDGVLTVGVATAADLSSAGKFEEDLWEEIVHIVDPTLFVCRKDGRIFESQTDFQHHMVEHERSAKSDMNQIFMGMPVI